MIPKFREFNKKKKKNNHRKLSENKHWNTLIIDLRIKAGFHSHELDIRFERSTINDIN